MIKRLFLLLILITYNFAFGQINSLVGIDILSKGECSVQSDLYGIIPSFQYTDHNLQNKVSLRFENLEFSGVNTDFSITIPVEIKFYDKAGSQLSGTEQTDLTIDWSCVGGDCSSNDEAVYITQKQGYKIDIKVRENDFDMSQLSYLTDHIVLEGEVLVDRIFKLSPFENVSESHIYTPDYTDPANSEEIEFKWDPVVGAVEYELSFYHVPDGYQENWEKAFPNGNFESDVSPRLQKEATRIVTNELNFKITSAYEIGKVYYSVRPIGKSLSDPSRKIYGHHFWDAQTYIDITDDFSGDRTWSYSAVYSSESKKGESVTYVDPTGRVRQQVSKDWEHGNVLVGEQFYGYLGEPMISVAPGVVPSTKMSFYESFTLNSDEQPYNKTNFASDDKLVGHGADPVNPAPNTPGNYHNNYFSPNNPFKGDGIHDYIADAKGYNFQQTVFNHKGKVKTASGIGPDHKLGSGHEVEISYASPNQAEIDRIFGNEVGDASHYSYAVTKNQDGQKSISYYNLAGQVIATALVGTPGNNLTEISSENYDFSSQFTRDILKTSEFNELNEHGELVLVNNLFIKQAGPQEFHYRFNAQSFSNCGFGQDCYFDIEVYIVNDLGNRVPLSNSKTEYKYSRLSSNSPPLEIDFSAELKEESYTIYRKISRNLDNIDQDVEAYLTHLETVGCQGDNGWQTEEEILEDLIITKSSDCKSTRNDCEEYVEEMARYYYSLEVEGYITHSKSEMTRLFNYPSAFTPVSEGGEHEQLEVNYDLNEIRTTTLFEKVYNFGKRYVCEELNTFDFNNPLDDELTCDGIKQELMSDMGSGGQYFENSPHPDNPNGFLKSKFDDIKDLKFYPYNSDGKLSSNSEDKAEFKDWNDLRDNWQAGYEEALVEGHPEYCNLIWCNEMEEYYNFQSELMFLNYTEAKEDYNVEINSLDNSQIIFPEGNVNFMNDPLHNHGKMTISYQRLSESYSSDINLNDFDYTLKTAFNEYTEGTQTDKSSLIKAVYKKEIKKEDAEEGIVDVVVWDFNRLWYSSDVLAPNEKIGFVVYNGLEMNISTSDIESFKLEENQVTVDDLFLAVVRKYLGERSRFLLGAKNMFLSTSPACDYSLSEIMVSNQSLFDTYGTEDEVEDKVEETQNKVEDDEPYKKARGFAVRFPAYNISKQSIEGRFNEIRGELTLYSGKDGDNEPTPKCNGIEISAKLESKSSESLMESYFNRLEQNDEIAKFALLVDGSVFQMYTIDVNQTYGYSSFTEEQKRDLIVNRLSQGLNLSASSKAIGNKEVLYFDFSGNIPEGSEYTLKLYYTSNNKLAFGDFGGSHHNTNYVEVDPNNPPNPYNGFDQCGRSKGFNNEFYTGTFYRYADDYYHFNEIDKNCLGEIHSFETSFEGTDYTNQYNNKNFRPTSFCEDYRCFVKTKKKAFEFSSSFEGNDLNKFKATTYCQESYNCFKAYQDDVIGFMPHSGSSSLKLDASKITQADIYDGKPNYLTGALFDRPVERGDQVVISAATLWDSEALGSTSGVPAGISCSFRTPTAVGLFKADGSRASYYKTAPAKSGWVNTEFVNVTVPKNLYNADETPYVGDVKLRCSPFAVYNKHDVTYYDDLKITITDEFTAYDGESSLKLDVASELTSTSNPNYLTGALKEYLVWEGNQVIIEATTKYDSDAPENFGKKPAGISYSLRDKDLNSLFDKNGKEQWFFPKAPNQKGWVKHEYANFIVPELYTSDDANSNTRYKGKIILRTSPQAFYKSNHGVTYYDNYKVETIGNDITESFLKWQFMRVDNTEKGNNGGWDIGNKKNNNTENNPSDYVLLVDGVAINTRNDQDVICVKVDLEEQKTYMFSFDYSSLYNSNPAELYGLIDNEVIAGKHFAEFKKWRENGSEYPNFSTETKKYCINNDTRVGGGNDFALDNIFVSEIIKEFDIPIEYDEECFPKEVYSEEDKSCGCKKIKELENLFAKYAAPSSDVFFREYYEELADGGVDFSNVNTFIATNTEYHYGKDKFTFYDDKNNIHVRRALTEHDVASWRNTCKLTKQTEIFDPFAKIVEPSSTNSFGNYPVILELNCDDPLAACEADHLDRLAELAKEKYQERVNTKLAAFKEDYITSCMTNISEEFWMDYTNYEYNYTLYYYDVIGNLISTVYPEGVRILSDPEVAGVQNFRAKNANNNTTNLTGAVFLETQSKHLQTQINDFEYNTLGEAIYSNSPDGGIANYFYDNLGRLIASQNAEQADGLDNFTEYNVTTFDDLGRIKQVGELKISTAFPLSKEIARGEDPMSFKGWMDLGQLSNVTKTVYDEPSDANVAIQLHNFGTGQQEFNRNRITSVEHYENDGDGSYTSAYHYRYDVHGLTTTHIQHNPDLHNAKGTEYKITNYDFDLFSGTVHQVDYQAGKEDQLLTKFEYDRSGRLKSTYTSTNNVTWDLDAKNHYYLHGPKHRMEVGDRQIQGIDVVSTLAGLKGVNSNTLNARRDVGRDGVSLNNQFNTNAQAKLHKSFARDAAGFVLKYYQNDYNPISHSGEQTSFEANDLMVNNSVDYKELFSGQITASSTAIRNLEYNSQEYLSPDVQYNTYKYDNAYNFIEQVVYKSNSVIASNSWDGAAIEGPSKEQSSYYVSVGYDLNKNIKRLKRNRKSNGNAGSEKMDDFHYKYRYTNTGIPAAQQLDLQSNRLYHVHDEVTNPNHNSDGDYQANASFSSNLTKDTEITNGAWLSSTGFAYNKLGQLTQNRAEGLSITWTSTGKTKTISRTNQNIKGDDLEFKYDAFGRRIIKIVKPRPEVMNGGQGTDVYVSAPQSDWEYTYYALDGSGVTQATYKHKFSHSANTRSYTARAIAEVKDYLGYEDNSSAHANFDLLVNGSKIGELNPSSGKPVTGDVLAQKMVDEINNNSADYTAEMNTEVCPSCISISTETNNSSGLSLSVSHDYYDQNNNSVPAAIILTQFQGGVTNQLDKFATKSTLEEHILYADSRLGIWQHKKDLTGTAPSKTGNFQSKLGDKYFEFKNWLGSVISVFKDVKYLETSPHDSYELFTSFEGNDLNDFKLTAHCEDYNCLMKTKKEAFELSSSFEGYDLDKFSSNKYCDKGNYACFMVEKSNEFTPFIGDYSIKLDPSDPNISNSSNYILGARIKKEVEKGDKILLSAVSLWENADDPLAQGTPGGISYSFKDKDGNFLYYYDKEEGVNKKTWYLSVAPKQSGWVKKNYVDNKIVPQLYDANGDVFTGEIYFGASPIVYTSSDVTYFDDLKITITDEFTPYSGNSSLKLDASTISPADIANGKNYITGALVDRPIKAGDHVVISAATLWDSEALGSTFGKPAAISCTFRTPNAVSLYKADGNRASYYKTAPAQSGWVYSEFVNVTVPENLYNADGTPYVGDVKLRCSPSAVYNRHDVTYFDDLKITITPQGENKYYMPVIVQSTDYYPYGMAMPGRNWKSTTDKYRYGYQGSEVNTEVDNGGGNQYTTEFRQLDARFGRWFSPDPVFQPHQSPYNSMDGDRINITDVYGLSGDYAKLTTNSQGDHKEAADILANSLNNQIF